MSTVLNGLLGGLVAGLVATLVAWRFDGELSVGEAVVSGVLGGASVSRWSVGLACVLYGTVAGGVFLLLELYVLGLLAVPPTTVEAFAAGVGWAVFLAGLWFVAGRLFAERSVRGSWSRWVVVYHAAYGLAFGTWIRVSWVT